MNRKILGTGWKFPISFDSGEVELVKEDEDIREAILIILNTATGERVMRPKFGCGIHNYPFSVINSSNIMMIESEIRTALTLYEPRVTIEDIRVKVDDKEEGRLMINIDYRVQSSNSRYNMVYPFYLTEKG